MGLDPQVKTLLDQLASVGAPGMRELDLATARDFVERLADLAAPAPELAGVEDRSFVGPGGDVPVRIYRPAPTAENDQPQPALVWFHGGGWVLGSLESTDPVCRTLAAEAGVVIVSVGYRLAPEHPFPAGVEDCYAALVWVTDNAAELGIDKSRLAVGGDSAGANLAAVVALAARDRDGPTALLQLLVYPVIDALQSHPSIRENGEGYMLTADAMRWFVELYLGEKREHGDPKDPLVSPLYAHDLSGLPPALVITAEFDPLRDEGEAYGMRLRQAGGTATVTRYDGMIHGFFGMDGIIAAARPAIDEAVLALKQALASPSSSPSSPENKEALA